LIKLLKLITQFRREIRQFSYYMMHAHWGLCLAIAESD